MMLDITIFDGDRERDDFTGYQFVGVSESIGRFKGLAIVAEILVRDPAGNRRTITQADFSHPVIVSIDNGRSFLNRPAYWLAEAVQ